MSASSKLEQSTFCFSSAQTSEVERNEMERSESSDAPTDVEKPKRPPLGGGPPGGSPPGGGPPGGPPPDLFKPKSVKFWMILLSNFLALFLVALDRTIVATAVPTISDEFHSLNDIGWYASAYMLTTSASQLLFGRIYKFYSMKWTFLVCVVVFEVGSVICAAAPSSTVFIIGRAVAGAASAGIFSGCMLIMIPMIPLHKRPMFQGLFGVVFGIASVVGPLVGGAFTSSVSWRWCFWINLPVGGFTLIFMIFFWNPPARKIPPAPFWTHVKRLDPLGTLFFLPGVVCLLLALQWGGSTYAWNSWRIIPLFILFAALMIAFTVVQIMLPETATLPGRVVKQRSVLAGALFTFFLSASMLMLVYFIPIWFQTAKQVSAIRSGIYTIPLVLSLVVSSIASGIGTQKIGYYVPSAIAAPCIMSIGQGLMSTFTPTTGSSHWIAYQFIAGFGLGLGMQIGNLAAQTVLKPEDIPAGVAIMFFVQQLGGAIFTSVGQTILSNLLVSQLSHIPGLDPETIVNAGATELATVVPARYLPLVIDAYNYGITRVFLTGMGLSFAALISALCLEWKTIKKRPGGPGGPPGAGGPPGGPPGGPTGVPTGPGAPGATGILRGPSVRRADAGPMGPDSGPKMAPPAYFRGAVPREATMSMPSTVVNTDSVPADSSLLKQSKTLSGLREQPEQPEQTRHLQQPKQYRPYRPAKDLDELHMSGASSTVDTAKKRRTSATFEYGERGGWAESRKS